MGDVIAVIVLEGLLGGARPRCLGFERQEFALRCGGHRLWPGLEARGCRLVAETRFILVLSVVPLGKRWKRESTRRTLGDYRSTFHRRVGRF